MKRLFALAALVLSFAGCGPSNPRGEVTYTTPCGMAVRNGEAEGIDPYERYALAVFSSRLNWDYEKMCKSLDYWELFLRTREQTDENGCFTSAARGGQRVCGLTHYDYGVVEIGPGPDAWVWREAYQHELVHVFEMMMDGKQGVEYGCSVEDIQASDFDHCSWARRGIYGVIQQAAGYGR